MSASFFSSFGGAVRAAGRKLFSGMATDSDDLLSLVLDYTDPLLGRSLRDLEIPVAIEGSQVGVTLGFPAEGYQQAFADGLRAHLGSRGERLQVNLRWQITAQNPRQGVAALPGIRNIIAIASGKGGVGKSTVAVNFAMALLAEGARVGLLDADIFGPSQPTMLGSRTRPTSPDGKRMHPILAHGLQAMSIGFLIDDEAQPAIWRGPMVTQALNQLLTETIWDDLDYLVIDLPPGTGDIQLSLAQRIAVSGAVVVTTPQDIALIDARKGLEMFRKVGVPVLGLVENMSTHVCTACGHEEAIFGSGGGEKMAAATGTELLGQIPLDLRIREQADAGMPIVAFAPDSAIARRYRDIARLAVARLAHGAAEVAFPSIAIVED